MVHTYTKRLFVVYRKFTFLLGMLYFYLLNLATLLLSLPYLPGHVHYLQAGLLRDAEALRQAVQCPHAT